MNEIYVTTIDVRKNQSVAKIRSFITPSVPTAKGSSEVSITPAYFYAVADSTARLFSEAARTVSGLGNDVVRKQAEKALDKLFYYLRNVGVHSRRLHKLSASESEDGACLIEWHFAKFHIGLSFEPDAKESFYFLVSTDGSIGRVETKTSKINDDLDTIISCIVQFVICNT